MAGCIVIMLSYFEFMHYLNRYEGTYSGRNDDNNNRDYTLRPDCGSIPVNIFFVDPIQIWFR